MEIIDLYKHSGYPIPSCKFDELKKQFDYTDLIGFGELIKEYFTKKIEQKELDIQILKDENEQIKSGFEDLIKQHIISSELRDFYRKK